MKFTSRDGGPHLPGAAGLREHIASLKMGIPQWAAKHRLNRVTVQRLVNGQMQVVSVELAAAIEDATLGDVRMRSWIHPAHIREQIRQERVKAARARHKREREEKNSKPAGDE